MSRKRPYEIKDPVLKRDEYENFEKKIRVQGKIKKNTLLQYYEPQAKSKRGDPTGKISSKFACIWIYWVLLKAGLVKDIASAISGLTQHTEFCNSFQKYEKRSKYELFWEFEMVYEPLLDINGRHVSFKSRLEASWFRLQSISYIDAKPLLFDESREMECTWLVQEECVKKDCVNPMCEKNFA